MTVGKNSVEMVLTIFNQIDGFLAILYADYLMIMMSQDAFNHVAVGLIVLDLKNPQRHCVSFRFNQF